MEKSKILFVVNPIAGKGNGKEIIKIIQKFFRNTKIDYRIEITKSKGHAKEISNQYTLNYDTIVAVGGDGTVNEVINGLDPQRSALGILPIGSGNGLANSLRIPLNTRKSLKKIVERKHRCIDMLLVNDLRCINVAGVGFDGFVSKVFSESNRRGLLTYVKIVLQEFGRYKNMHYKLEIDGKPLSINSFLISFANSTQFGNNAYIAPQAKIDDGLLDVCILKKVSILSAPELCYRLFFKKINNYKYYESLKAKNISIHFDHDLYAHVDGEYYPVSTKTVNIKILPSSIKVIN